MAGPPPPSAPWTAPPPPPSWAPRPPRPHRRRVWIYLLVGAVVVIVGLAVASGTIWIQKVKPPIDAANDYLRDLSRGDYEAAFDQLCAAEKVDASPEGLAGAAADLDVDEYEVSPFDVNRDGSRATVKVELSPDDLDGTDRFVRMRLEEIDGEWRPCGPLYGFEFARSSD
ncbi:MAG TPA: hypothetical protein VKC52_11900 [Acidimicrobiia bacterium]|nr:hypothetical protein [Acidimicrobiia bacterium]